jgi:predicted metal-binding protein
VATRLNRAVASRWEGALLVCGKCSRKLDGGFGPKRRTPLAKALRRWLGFGKGRKARLGVVETRCLGVCPRGAVCIVDTRRPGTWQLVEAGDALDAVAARLELARDEARQAA